MAYKYSVVSFLPDITAGEHVNIGIELHDMDTRVLYRRYSFGHKGVQKMHEIFFSGIIKSPDIEQDVDYLVKEHGRDRGIYNRIFFSDVRGGIKHTDKPEKMEDILEHLYDMFVVIDKKDDK